MKKSLQTILALSFVASVAIASTPTSDAEKVAKTYFEAFKDKMVDMKDSVKAGVVYGYERGIELGKSTYASTIANSKTICDIVKAHPYKSGLAVAGTAAVVGGGVYAYKRYQVLRKALNAVEALTLKNFKTDYTVINEALNVIGSDAAPIVAQITLMNNEYVKCSGSDVAFNDAKYNAITLLKVQINSTYRTMIASKYVQAVDYVKTNKAKVAAVTAVSALALGLGYKYVAPYVAQTEIYKKAAAKASELTGYVGEKLTVAKNYVGSFLPAMPAMPAIFSKTEEKEAANETKTEDKRAVTQTESEDFFNELAEASRKSREATVAAREKAAAPRHEPTKLGEAIQNVRNGLMSFFGYNGKEKVVVTPVVK